MSTDNAGVHIKDNRQGTNDIVAGNIIKITELYSDTIKLYLDTGYTIILPKNQITEFLMLDKLEKSK